MLEFFLSSFLSVSAVCTNGQCQDRLALNITFTGTVDSTSTISATIENISKDASNLARVDVEYSTTGNFYAETRKLSYLLIDKTRKQKHGTVTILVMDPDKIFLILPDTMYGTKWPEGWNKEEVVAFYDIVRDTRKKLAKH